MVRFSGAEPTPNRLSGDAEPHGDRALRQARVDRITRRCDQAKPQLLRDGPTAADWAKGLDCEAK